MAREDEYADFVPHPRYGRKPRLTGLNPTTTSNKPGEPIVKLHWHTGKESRIPNTAVEADISKQIFTTFPVTHYFDAKRTCHGCKRPFIFFAEEQRHWYEDLGFSIEANCVRCVTCRKQAQGIAHKRQRYEELFHAPNPSHEELLEMAECCLGLIEAKQFPPRQQEKVRSLLNRLPDHLQRKQKLLARLKKLG